MARPLRIEYPDAWYHVMNRGRRGENIFADRTDYEIFLGVLQDSSVLFNGRFAAFCLMSNHYHILVQTPLGNLSRIMRHINGVYTQHYNRRHAVDGQLFRGRYKSVLVDADNHLLELLRYIHRNPVRADICNSVGDYPWSSHRAYVSKAEKWAWVYQDFLLSMFSKIPGKAEKEYRKFVQHEEPEEIKDFFSKTNLPSIMGSIDFVDWVKAKYYLAKKHDEVPQAKDLAPTIQDIKRAVGLAYRTNMKELETTRRGRKSEPRNVAIYLARMHSSLTLEEIGKNFNYIKYSSVSNIVRKVKKQLSADHQFSQKVAFIEQRLHVEQRKT
ncbi:MAG: transposase [Oceanipulchritudo sp.]